MATGPRPLRGATLGERLVDALEQASFLEGTKVTKAELARRLGVRWATVHDWTSNTTAPSAEHLRQIAEVMPVDLEELLGVAAGQDPPFEAWPAFLATAEGRGITAEERRSLQGIPWQRGREPTVASYQIALASLRTTKERGG